MISNTLNIPIKVLRIGLEVGVFCLGLEVKVFFFVGMLVVEKVKVKLKLKMNFKDLTNFYLNF